MIAVLLQARYLTTLSLESAVALSALTLSSNGRVAAFRKSRARAGGS